MQCNWFCFLENLKNTSQTLDATNVQPVTYPTGPDIVDEILPEVKQKNQIGYLNCTVVNKGKFLICTLVNKGSESVVITYTDRESWERGSICRPFTFVACKVTWPLPSPLFLSDPSPALFCGLLSLCVTVTVLILPGFEPESFGMTVQHSTDQAGASRNMPFMISLIL